MNITQWRKENGFPEFTAKEHRYLEYASNKNNSLNIGDMCKALKTTPRTLIGKTIPEAIRKYKIWEQRLEELEIEYGLKDRKVITFPGG
jgi:hypothetical protein